jgi:hypothetical protein
MNAITKLQNKLAKLQNRLTKFQKIGICRKLKRTAMDLIFKIARLEQVIEDMEKIEGVFEVKLYTPKKCYHSWLAKISKERDPRYGGFKKRFIEPTNRIFNRRGEEYALYEIPITLEAIYQDSDGDFWRFRDLEGNTVLMSYQEVCYRFREGESR